MAKNAFSYVRMLPAVLLRASRVPLLPPHVQLDVTTRCNLNCAMCYAKGTPAGSVPADLTLAQFQAMIDAIRPVSVNLAASGEPLMNPDLFAMLQYARAAGIQTIVSTNFILPDAAMVRRLVTEGPDILKISIDGATPDVYAGIRGAHFDRLRHNLSALAAECAAHPQSPVSVRIDYVLLKSNAADIEGIIGLAQEFGIGHVFYRICDPRGWDNDRRQHLLAGSYAAIHDGLAAAARRAAAAGIVTNCRRLRATAADWRFIYDDGGMTAPAGRKRPVCLLPWLQYFVSVTGETSCCCSLYPTSGISCGNLLQLGAAAVWNGDPFHRMRRQFAAKKNYTAFEGCRYCIPLDAGYLSEIVGLFPRYLQRLVTGLRKEHR